MQYRKRQGDITIKKHNEYKESNAWKWPEIADKAVPNQTDIETRILVEMYNAFWLFSKSFFSYPITTLSSQSIWWSSSKVYCAAPDLCSSPFQSALFLFEQSEWAEDAVRLVPSGRAKSRCHDPDSLVEPGGFTPHCGMATPVLHSQGTSPPSRPFKQKQCWLETNTPC